MALIRSGINATDHEEARQLLDLYRKGGREPRLEDEVVNELARRRR